MYDKVKNKDGVIKDGNSKEKQGTSVIPKLSKIESDYYLCLIYVSSKFYLLKCISQNIC